MSELLPSLLLVAVGVLGYAMHALRQRATSQAFIWPRDMNVHLHVTPSQESAWRLPMPPNPEPQDVEVETEPELSAEDNARPQSMRFVVDSLTLLTCYQYLFANQPRQRMGVFSAGFRESFHYLTGVRVDSETYVLSHLLPVRFARQEAGGVQVSQPSNIEMFTALDGLELPLVGHCHSHPGTCGVASTSPSGVDHRFQARLERGGCRAIGLIFARCNDPGVAFVRFFAGNATEFTVDVQRAHVEQVEDHVFKISLDHDQLPIPTIVGR